MATVPQPPEGPPVERPRRDRKTIVKEMVNSENKQGKKLRAHKDRNFLIPVFMNAFAKRAENKELSDLEKIIIQSFDQEGFPREITDEAGRIYQEEVSPEVRREIFPAETANLKRDDKYTVENLKRDVPNILKRLEAQPNVITIDARLVHAGRSLRDTGISRAEMMADPILFSSTMLLIKGAEEASPGTRYSMKAHSFRCVNETGPDWSGSDEPYWIFNSTVDKGEVVVASRSQVFSDVDTGESRNFSTTDGWLWANGFPAPLPEASTIGVHIQLWEHDYGDPATIQKGVAAAFAAAAGILAATGVAAWIGAVVAGVGAVVGWLLGFLDEDHIADMTTTFSKKSIDYRIDQELASTGRNYYDHVQRFSDGDGDYQLRIRITRMA